MMNGQNPELEEALKYPLFSAIFGRRSRRISKGISSIPAGSLSYTSTQEAQPLTPLEEALLVACTGATGMTMADMPFQTEDGKDILGSPMINIRGRAAGSPDNAQATHFFLINDSGTYFLKQPEDFDPFTFSQGTITPEKLIDYTQQCKVKVLDERLDFPREFPCYLGNNRYVSNLPGSTILVPIVDVTKQYINGLMYLLEQDDGFRPHFLDDWNFYKKAGVKKWLRNGFLNKEIPLPLGALGSFRIQIEADLLAQNLLPALIRATLAWPGPVKAGLGLVLLALPAVALGMPFPLALRRLAADRPAHIPWAWAVNGCFSVLAAPLASLLAMQAGLSALGGLAAAAYLAAALASGARAR